MRPSLPTLGILALLLTTPTLRADDPAPAATEPAAITPTDTKDYLSLLVPHDNLQVDKTPEGLELKCKSGEARDMTSATFATPFTLTAVAKTDSTNLRLYFGPKGQLIFNWLGKPDQLRLRDPASGQNLRADNKGAIPANQFVTIQWTVTNTDIHISVDGTERASFHGDYAHATGHLGIGTIKQSIITVKSFSVGPAAPDTPTADASTTPNHALPSDTSSPPPPPADPNAIEYPAYRTRLKSLVKSLSTIHGMAVNIQSDGSEIGGAAEVFATVPGDSRDINKSSAIFVRKGEGSEMQTSFDEAIRAVKLRYPRWENGRIEVSFGDKYSAKDGGSGGTAFGVLLLSILEGYNIDPSFAVTGDITVDWRVREVGGVVAKLAGVTADGCKYAAIPDSNESDVDDLRLLHGDAALWNLQIFSIDTLQHASLVMRTPHDANTADAMKEFDAARDLFIKDGKNWSHDPALRTALTHILTLAPNHLSARHLLAVMDNTAPKTLSLAETIQQYNSITYLYREFVSGKIRLNRLTLPQNQTIATRRRIAVLRSMADKRVLPLLNEFSNFAEFIDEVAGGKGTLAEAKTRFEALASQQTALHNP